jgi:hypothetical protein
MTVVRPPGWFRTGTWIVCPALGAALGWLIKALAGWVASLPWAPMQGPFKLVDSVPEPQATLGAFAVGVLAGLVFAFFVQQDNLTVTITADDVRFDRGAKSTTVKLVSVDAAFLDRKHLVLLGLDGGELAREATDLDAGQYGRAFSAHGLRWLTEDPYAAEFRLWVEDIPGLPAGANALFKARDRLLHKGSGDDVAALREELVSLGLVVRDEKKRQYWRLAGKD